MPFYKLTYFDLRSRGDLIRYVFLVSGIEFEDRRVEYGGSEWPELKPKTKFGQIPILEVDGKELAQSYAIARYLAKEFGLVGETSWDLALIDQFYDLTEDLYKDILKEFYEKDKAKKKELLNNLADVLYPKFLKMFEKALEENGGKYFVGDSLTLADLAVYTVFDTPLIQVPTLLDSYPILKAHRQMVEANAKLAEYVNNRKVDII